MLGAVADLSGSDHDVAVVKHRGLAGGDPVAGRVENDPETAGYFLDGGRRCVGAVAQLHRSPVDRQIETSGDIDRRARERRPRADDDGVRARVRTQRVQRLWGRDAESLALPRREPPVTGMPPELAAFFVDNRAIDPVETATLEEGAVVVAGEETCFLALAPPRDPEPRALGVGARLGLRLFAEREDDAVELRGIELCQHVRLILLVVRPAREQAPTAALANPCVVTGRQRVGACMTRKCE